MRKGKLTITITIGLICFILMLIIFMQFKIVYQTDITSIDTMREEDLKEELVSWKSKYEEAQEKYNEVTETLKKYNEESSSDTKTKQNLEAELENIKLLLGITDVEGQGLIITLSDPENLNEYTDFDEENTKKKVDYLELIRIINYLKEAGAEAISINDKRVVYNTDVVNISDSYIKINSQRISAPFEIKAIGDPDYLKSELIATGYVETIKNWGQKIEFNEKKKIEIKKYDGKMENNYIKSN